MIVGIGAPLYSSACLAAYSCTCSCRAAFYRSCLIWHSVTFCPRHNKALDRRGCRMKTMFPKLLSLCRCILRWMLTQQAATSRRSCRGGWGGRGARSPRGPLAGKTIPSTWTPRQQPPGCNSMSRCASRHPFSRPFSAPCRRVLHMVLWLVNAQETQSKFGHKFFRSDVCMKKEAVPTLSLRMASAAAAHADFA